MSVVLPWYEWLNVIACVVVLCYGFFACYVMPNRGMWMKRLLLWAVVGMLGMQVASPWALTLPTVTWYTSLLHVSMSAALIVWHKCVVRFIVGEFLYTENLDTDNAPLDSRTAYDYVHNMYVTNRRRVLRRIRDRETQQPNDRRKT